MAEIDGDLLLVLREGQLRDDLGMDNSVHRMRRVKHLQLEACLQWCILTLGLHQQYKLNYECSRCIMSMH